MFRTQTLTSFSSFFYLQLQAIRRLEETWVPPNGEDSVFFMQPCLNDNEDEDEEGQENEVQEDEDDEDQPLDASGGGENDEAAPGGGGNDEAAPRETQQETEEQQPPRRAPSFYSASEDLFAADENAAKAASSKTASNKNKFKAPFGFTTFSALNERPQEEDAASARGDVQPERVPDNQQDRDRESVSDLIIDESAILADGDEVDDPASESEDED